MRRGTFSNHPSRVLRSHHVPQQFTTFPPAPSSALFQKPIKQQNNPRIIVCFHVINYDAPATWEVAGAIHWTRKAITGGWRQDAARGASCSTLGTASITSRPHVEWRPGPQGNAGKNNRMTSVGCFIGDYRASLPILRDSATEWPDVWAGGIMAKMHLLSF